MGHEPDDLWDEVAFLAYHLHWGLDGLLDLEHADRERLVEAVSGMNEQAWERAEELG